MLDILELSLSSNKMSLDFLGCLLTAEQAIVYIGIYFELLGMSVYVNVFLFSYLRFYLSYVTGLLNITFIPTV